MPQFSDNQPPVSLIEQLLNKYFKWLAGVVAIIILGLSSWLLLWPKYSELRNMTQAEDLQVKLDQKEQLYQSIKQKISVWRTMKQNQPDDFNLILPRVVDIPGLLVQMESIAVSAKVQLQAVSITASGGNKKGGKAPAGAQTVGLVVSLQGGDYTDFKNLLTEISQAWRLLQVDSFSYSNGTYSLQLTGYYYP